MDLDVPISLMSTGTRYARDDFPYIIIWVKWGILNIRINIAANLAVERRN